jgi:hypothetical protein
LGAEFRRFSVVWRFASILFARRFRVLPKRWLAFHVAVVRAFTFGHFWLMEQFAAGI